MPLTWSVSDQVILVCILVPAVRIPSLICRGRDSTPATGSKSVLLSAASKISHPLSQKQTMPHPAHPAISVSLAEGGSNDESNLMSLCRSCHEKIHRERGDR